MTLFPPQPPPPNPHHPFVYLNGEIRLTGDLADLYGDPEAPATRPRVSRAAAALHDRAPGHRKPRRYPPPIGFAGARRDPAAYGKRCHECGRPAHGVEHCGPPVCKLHNTDIPF